MWVYVLDHEASMPFIQEVYIAADEFRKIDSTGKVIKDFDLEEMGSAIWGHVNFVSGFTQGSVLSNARWSSLVDQ